MADLYGDVYQSFVTTVDQRDGDDLDTVNGVIHRNRSAVRPVMHAYSLAIEELPTSGYAWHLQLVVSNVTSWLGFSRSRWL